MVTQRKHRFTPEEYLARERVAEYKSEYLDGQILAMSGASRAHNRITVNISRQLGNQFEGRPCQVYVSDMRVRVTPKGQYVYPDVVAVCGREEYADAELDTLLNPTVLFEVLSPSTQGTDRGRKLLYYGQLASLSDYILVEQDRVQVDHCVRQGPGWYVTTLSSLDDTLRLESLGVTLPLAAIYANVEIAAPAEAD